MSFLEKLANRKLRFSDEIFAIEKLMHAESKFAGHPSIYLLMEKNFINWKHRQTFVEFEKMKFEMGIKEIVEKPWLLTVDSFIYYLEFIYNILSYTDDISVKFNTLISLDVDKVTYNRNLNNINHNSKIIKENINEILNEINYELVYIKKKDEWKIIEKEYLVSSTAEIIGEEEFNLGEDIYLYKHNETSGKLKEKNKILCLIAKFFKNNVEATLIANSQKQLADDIGFIANKCNVRHGIKEDKKVEIIMKNITPEKQEEYYDNLFKLYLLAINIKDYIYLKPFVKEFNKIYAESK